MSKINFDNLYKHQYLLILALGVIAIVVAIQDYLLGVKIVDGAEFTYYNNYLIFKQSYFNLISSQDLYDYNFSTHFDLFKYSSTFALFFGAFSYFPDVIGLMLWNIFNLLILYYALKSLPSFTDKKLYFIFFIVLFELFTTVQNEQSNTLMIALFLFAFSNLEKRKYFWATFCVVFSIYAKLYGVVAFSLFLFYPNKLKLFYYTILWFVILFFIPLIVVNYEQLLFNYQSWMNLLIREHPQIYGISIMGVLNSWFGLAVNKVYPLIVGIIIFCIPLFRLNLYKHYYYRLMVLSSILIWVVIFNHRAESPSYIIACVGAGIWYLNSPKSVLNTSLIVLVFILTTLSATDLFPVYIRENYVKTYTLKAVPIILVWFKLLYDLVFTNFKTLESSQTK